jgi:hypothetical protein
MGDLLEQSTDRDADRDVDDEICVEQLVGRTAHIARMEPSSQRVGFGITDVFSNSALAPPPSRAAHTSPQSMQDTQPSTSVPSSAIWRSRM